MARILVIDDDDEIRRMVKAMLMRADRTSATDESVRLLFWIRPLHNGPYFNYPLARNFLPSK